MRFAVDDAGAGFASMRHVTKLGPAYVKLDAYLVRGMRSRQTLRAFLRALNGFTIEIGAAIIAEGVEKAGDWLSWPRPASHCWPRAMPSLDRGRLGLM